MNDTKKNSYYPVLFVLFLISGFCGLLYQIVWLRLAFAAFGIITPVLSVVLSVFMLGLAVGSWAGGKYIKSLTEKTGKSAIVFYALMEILIGIGGLVVPKIFETGRNMLLTAGSFDSFSYLLLSAVILGISILPWCICMGATVPLMMAFIKEFNRDNTRGFSYLYLANVIGAMCGTIFTAVFLIELLGLLGTLLVAVCCNFGIAVVAFVLNSREPYRKSVDMAEQIITADIKPLARSNIMLSILFITGFTSMAMEVVWTRAFTLHLRTTIYAFAGILAVYLLATWLGSWFYRKQAAENKVIDISYLMAHLSYFCFLPILAGDVRLWNIMSKDGLRAILLISIFPFCAALGYLTPKLVDEFSQGNPKLAGKAYAINTIGCILGPLFAGYLILSVFSVRYTLVILAVPFIVYFVYYFKRTWIKNSVNAGITGILTVGILSGSMVYFKNYDEGALYKNGEVRRDHVATVISTGEGLNKRLLVNGVGMTILTPITKFMAHLPLAIRDREPESALIICLGMGTTFRSASAWGVDTTAVELVPSVSDAFGFYFDDADEVLKRPNARIVVDDGRRFLKRTGKKFDIITIDPPPPITSAGSGLLYSEEFYKVLKTRLREGGIMAQWFPFGEEMTFHAVVKSISKEFPFVRVFHSIDNWGYHFFASMEPFEMPSASDFVKRLPRDAASDFIEWNTGKTPKQLYMDVIQKEIPLQRILPADVTFSITDNRPFNEYFLVRRKINKLKNRHRNIW
ncbi:MAG: fused MFS/spermidine synthase [Elusimicrobia bacterium]|nr:fused MFS/spermidine synthase [Elusimicrobiota bacterium]